MEDYIFEEEKTVGETGLFDDEDLDTPEEGFVKGYAEEEEVAECSECGTAVSEEKKIVKDFEGEKYVFCSKECVKEFKESMG